MTPPSPGFDISKLIDYYENLTPVSPQDSTAHSHTRTSASPSPRSTQPTPAKTAKSPPAIPPIETIGFAELALNPNEVPATSSIPRFSQSLQVFHMHQFWSNHKRKRSPSLPSSSNAPLVKTPKASKSGPSAQSNTPNTNNQPPPVSASEMYPALPPTAAQLRTPSTLPSGTDPGVLDTDARALQTLISSYRDRHPPRPFNNALSQSSERGWDDQRIEEWQAEIPRTVHTERRRP